MKLIHRKDHLRFALAAVVFAVILSSWPVGAQTGKTPSPQKSIPMMVDVGAKKCIPCKMMAPILEELKKEYDGVLVVEFVDVWENPNAGEKYRIRSIPTQIFYDATGKEFYRHAGYFSKEQILDTFRKNGFDIKKLSK